MSLSTLTPHVCSRNHPPLSSNKDPPSPSPPPVSLPHVFHATTIAATATALSQLITTPLDVASRSFRKSPSPSILHSLLSLIRQKGPAAAFHGLHLNTLKRLPTKALTVTLFELATQLLSHHSTNSTLSTTQHLSIALTSGVTALLATYPIHLAYYSIRKGLTFRTVLRCAQMQPRIAYSGAIPAVISTFPAVLVDYVMYKSLKDTIDQGQGNAVHTAMAIVTAATVSNLTGGFFSEPFKALSRRMAVDSVRSASCGSLRGTAMEMYKGGIGEFWRGFRIRSVRYAVSAVVTKTTVQRLQVVLPGVRGRVSGGEDAVEMAPAARGLVGAEWVVGRHRGCRGGRGAVRMS